MFKYEIFNTYLREDGSGSTSMVVSAIVDTAKKFIQFGISVFLEAKKINLWGNFQGSKCDRYCIFLWELFPFYEKVPSPLDPVDSSRNTFTPDVFNWSSLVNNMQLY